MDMEVAVTQMDSPHDGQPMVHPNHFQGIPLRPTSFWPSHWVVRRRFISLATVFGRPTLVAPRIDVAGSLITLLSRLALQPVADKAVQF